MTRLPILIALAAATLCAQPPAAIADDVPKFDVRKSCKADVQAYKAKVETFVARAKEAVRQGVGKDQLMTRIKTDDLGWTPRVPNVDLFYAELSKEQ